MTEKIQPGVEMRSEDRKPRRPDAFLWVNDVVSPSRDGYYAHRFACDNCGDMLLVYFRKGLRWRSTPWSGVCDHCGVAQSRAPTARRSGAQPPQ